MFFKKKKKPEVFVTDSRLDSVAIITDGNGRWAKKRGLPRSKGHIEGAKRSQPALEKFRELGIHYVTLYAFSTENWKRPKEEVETIMKLVYKYVDEVVIKKIKCHGAIFAAAAGAGAHRTAAKAVPPGFPGGAFRRHDAFRRLFGPGGSAAV